MGRRYLVTGTRHVKLPLVWREKREWMWFVSGTYTNDQDNADQGIFDVHAATIDGCDEMLAELNKEQTNG